MNSLYKPGDIVYSDSHWSNPSTGKKSEIIKELPYNEQDEEVEFLVRTVVGDKYGHETWYPYNLRLIMRKIT